MLVQREGAKDFFWKTRMIDLDRDDLDDADRATARIDIHHIFPSKWCQDRDIPRSRFDAIVNKTAISYKANRTIGGKAPSSYLAQLEKLAGVSGAALDDILQTHFVAPELLRADNFDAFYAARKKALLELVERAMGKTVGLASEAVAEDEDVDDEDGEAEEAAQ